METDYSKYYENYQFHYQLSDSCIIIPYHTNHSCVQMDRIFGS